MTTSWRTEFAASTSQTGLGIRCGTVSQRPVCNSQFRGRASGKFSGTLNRPIWYHRAKPSRRRKASEAKWGLTYSYIGIYIYVHAKSRYNIGWVQCRGRAAAAGDLELSGAPGAGGGRYRRRPRDGTALGFEASGSPAPGWPGTGAAEWEAHVLSNQRRSDPAAA